MKKITRGRKRQFVPEPIGHRTLEQFGAPENLPGLNVIGLGFAVFQIEQALKLGKVDSAVLPIFRGANQAYDLEELSRIIHDLLIFTVTEDIDITFREIRPPQNSKHADPDRKQVESLCLFSGGIDSYAGILLAAKKLGSVDGLFCAHSDQARMIHIVSQLARKISAEGLTIYKQIVPRVGARGYAQLRGFLYIASAAGWLHSLGANRLLVTECGPTMYQPRFSPVDAITMTTHPFVVASANRVIDLVLGRHVVISTPFENLTKAEVVALSPIEPGLRFTHSCITQRFGNHDGTCYGCVIRRLATISAAREDVRYLKNPISNASARSGNLLSLLTFCHDILTRYDQMEEYEIGTIEYYGKRDLFVRFALDNFAAVHKLLGERHSVQRAVMQLYESIVARIGAGPLEARLAALNVRSFDLRL